MPNSRQTSAMASPSRSRATKRRRSSITELAFHGIHTSRRTKAESVTHVSGTFCHLCLGPLNHERIRYFRRHGFRVILVSGQRRVSNHHKIRAGETQSGTSTGLLTTVKVSVARNSVGRPWTRNLLPSFETQTTFARSPSGHSMVSPGSSLGIGRVMMGRSLPFGRVRLSPPPASRVPRVDRQTALRG